MKPALRHDTRLCGVLLSTISSQQRSSLHTNADRKLTWSLRITPRLTRNKIYTRTSFLGIYTIGWMYVVSFSKATSIDMGATVES
ncbi:hypothetical protein EJ05DRAFT_226795 [Pseudovirgaria hyperparasitica]|uniref:Uncharacterized protein n=1 Tax=Pseudovirgaria hyperparasitica TaxID=470096 RepID=A0A6A6VSE3_9PEZI|nr:uncharacterized protein EJ05DRAFT_226795 [Pseudovirgaria hyperparasitica]KAF2753143.1 hypothetical protein EJ05DRAFT_226795 [Pseudovirgaria hyperparasitica]